MKNNSLNFQTSVKTGATLVLLFFAFSVFAQKSTDAYDFSTRGQSKIKRKGMNLPNYTNEKFHFGVSLAIHYTTLRVRTSQAFADDVKAYLADPEPVGSRKETIFGIDPIGVPGFTFGFIVPNFRLNRHFEIRFQPSISFYNRYINFRYGLPTGDSISTQLNQSLYSFIEPQLLLKYCSIRRNNTRMYMIAGIKPGFEVGSKRKELDDRVLRLRSNDLSLEYGIGLELFYPKFKFAPELRFSWGLTNLMFPDQNQYTRTLERLNTYTATLYFNFEG